MKIGISGGWGYGNLGDDAILAALSNLLDEVAPLSDHRVFAYDVDEMSKYAQLIGRVTLQSSFHADIDFGSSRGMYRSVYAPASESGSFNRALFYGRKRLADCYGSELMASVRHRRLALSLDDLDLFVLGGGGYFNEFWWSSAVAHLCELERVAERGIPFVVAGPTFGVFKNTSFKRRLSTVLRKSRAIYVRDEPSLIDLRALGVDAQVIPDIALTSFSRCASKKPQRKLGIVLTTTEERILDTVAGAIAAISREQPDLQFGLHLTRLWQHDLHSISRLQKRLTKFGVDATIHIPNSYTELETRLAECSAVISQNLHGLILATRNCVPVVTVNDWAPDSAHDRKFSAFVRQIGGENSVVNSRSKSVDVAEMIRLAIAVPEAHRHALSGFCEGVRSQALNFFRAALQ
jgi:polysaccharide pyruvyl transferase WcaK-like protein